MAPRNEYEAARLKAQLVLALGGLLLVLVVWLILGGGAAIATAIGLVGFVWSVRWVDRQRRELGRQDFGGMILFLIMVVVVVAWPVGGLILLVDLIKDAVG